jgi:hypothetical protein
MMNLGDRSSSDAERLSDRLSFDEHYPCPICRYGQLERLFMVEAFTCTFCRHIFTVDASQQYLHLEDNAQPLKWRRQADQWVSARTKLSPDWMLMAWSLGIVFVSVPTTLVGLAYHTFPPLPGQSGSVFPLVWIGLTFLSHGLIVGWLCLEHYQFPLYMVARLYLRRLFSPALRRS